MEKEKIKSALISGISGQDGSYLAELLLEKGYEVHGLVRRVAAENQDQRFSRIKHLLAADQIKIHYGDVCNYPTLWRLIAMVQPDEFYHLASQSNAVISLEDDFGAFATNALSTHYILSSLKELKPECRFFFAGTAEMYGNVKTSPQDEQTPFYPDTPYSISKSDGYYFTKTFRERYNLFACTGILFAHESPRRGFDFVTRKITSTAAKIKAGLENKLALGNLDARKDWGFSGDYVKAMWLMLQQEKPDDYVIGTGISHSVKEFVEKVFTTLGLDWQKYVVVDQKFFRPQPAFEIVCNPQKANTILGWKPEILFEDLADMMAKNDLAIIESK